MKTKNEKNSLTPTQALELMRNKTSEPTLETQRDKEAALRRDDLPTVEQNARLFRSLNRLQRRAQGKKVWR